MHLMYGSDNINYRIGIYIRLSREDGDDLESESVSNQRSLLMDFLLSNNLTLVDEYVDDGYSGGNFERPSFKRLLKDIRLKKIDALLLKTYHVWEEIISIRDIMSNVFFLKIIFVTLLLMMISILFLKLGEVK